jgi:hypothetical protein
MIWLVMAANRNKAEIGNPPVAVAVKAIIVVNHP